MDPRKRFCHNRSCWAYGRPGERHIVIHLRVRGLPVTATSCSLYVYPIGTWSPSGVLSWKTIAQSFFMLTTVHPCALACSSDSSAPAS